jgi:hypothetical protein
MAKKRKATTKTKAAKKAKATKAKVKVKTAKRAKAPVPEATGECIIMLTGVGHQEVQKLQTIRAVMDFIRRRTEDNPSMLAIAKALVDNAVHKSLPIPSGLHYACSRDEAEELKAKLGRLGGTAEVQETRP